MHTHLPVCVACTHIHTLTQLFCLTKFSILVHYTAPKGVKQEVAGTVNWQWQKKL